jgi:Na+-transporting methylmalonyl-CoA/oxaloacetate decarboxylase gamma subunit
MGLQQMPLDTAVLDTIVFDTAVARDHGLGLAVTGMSVVFVGLVLVTLFIAVLPRLLDRARDAAAARERARDAAAARDRRTQAAGAAASPRDHAGMDPDLLAAIGFVLQAEYERELLSDHQRITLRDDDEEQRVWTAMGKMRTLATRM